MVTRLSYFDVVAADILSAQLGLPISKTRAKIVIKSFVRNNATILCPKIRKCLPRLVLSLKKEHIVSVISDALLYLLVGQGVELRFSIEMILQIIQSIFQVIHTINICLHIIVIRVQTLQS